MQSLGYLDINGQKILVLYRLTTTRNEWFGFKLKLRKSGKDGSFLVDESHYLKENPELLADLLSGKVILC